MSTLANFPMVSQRTTITSDGKASEDALYDCVPASIGSIMLWEEGKSQWDASINPDLLKDKVYGDSYTGGTSAARYVDICKSMGFHLYNIDTSSPEQTVALAHQLLAQNKPVIFTMLDPYVDTNLNQYANWTHVCVWFADDSGGLTAMDPFIAQPVYKSNVTWQNLLRANQLWSLEKMGIVNAPIGWHDDGVTLTAPNGIPVVLGFRAYVLRSAWDKDNYPLGKQFYTEQLEGSNPDLGPGDQQVFRKTLLAYPHNPQGAVASLKDTVIEEYIGVELLYRLGLYSQIYSAYQQKVQQLAQMQAQIDQLTAQLSQSQQMPQALATVQQIKQMVSAF